MKILLLCFCFAILQSIHCISCPDGFALTRNGECRGFYATFKEKHNAATSVAIAKCNEIKTELNEVQGQTFIIRDAEDDNYWGDYSTNSRLVILGLVCNTTSKAWQWADGSTMQYKPISSLNDACATGCVWFLKNRAWTKWCDADVEQFNLYCTVQLHQPVLHAEGCNGFDDDNEDGVCYVVGEAAETWQEAQLNCKKLGANLASIHNANENNFVRRLAVSRGDIYGIFIGATVTGKGGEFGWIDGTDWDYSNYYPGFPKNGFGDCLVLDTSTPTGQWLNMDCASKLPVACVRGQKPATERNITCSTDPYVEEKIISSPGFPFNASMPCEYYMQVDAGKKVEVDIDFLEANSCCDFLTVYDGYVGGKIIANLTGEVRNRTFTTTSSNIMKVSWQPNGGVNVRGMAMTFRGV